jgi:catechol 2,3-dioxygenase-like lactoylglutathione lyase family enzyme
VDAKLWNIGVKVADVAAESAYFLALGGRLLAHERLVTPDGEAEYALLEFGGTRLFLTPKPIFQDQLASPPPDGLTHAVFEVDDLKREVERLAALGTRVLIAPTEISGAFGSRQIAFFRSPGGLVFEVMQITRDPPPRASAPAGDQSQ